eukprot:COSAG02_NODE_85_length_39411_cov_50.018493_5_plen_194_part_00
MVCDAGLSCVVDNPWPFPVHRCTDPDTPLATTDHDATSTAYSPPVSESDVIPPTNTGYAVIRTATGTYDGERVPLDNSRCGNSGTLFPATVEPLRCHTLCISIIFNLSLPGSVGGLLLDRGARVSCTTPERPYCIDSWHDLAREGGSRGKVTDRPNGDDRIDGRCEARDAKRAGGASDAQERLYDYNAHSTGR